MFKFGDLTSDNNKAQKAAGMFLDILDYKMVILDNVTLSCDWELQVRISECYVIRRIIKYKSNPETVVLNN